MISNSVYFNKHKGQYYRVLYYCDVTSRCQCEIFEMGREGSTLDFVSLEVLHSSEKILNPDFLPSNHCDHKWKHYLGLSERFEYCQHCNVKRS